MTALCREAFDVMLKGPTFRQAAKERNLKVDPMSAAEIAKVVQNVSATPEPVIKMATIATQAPGIG
jgi:tripartite-type tricarboxylate transporter receptor subunit TctC